MLVTNNKAAVDKLAGAIKPQIKITGKIMGKNALLKSLMYSCLVASDLAKNKIRAISAKSDVWKVLSIQGMVIHLLASFISVPKNMV